MIHQNDERLFRVFEITCYVGFFCLVGVLKAHRHQSWPYFMPLTFVGLGLLGMVFMTRFFVYAYPERVWDRTRAAAISIPRPKKIALALGYSMCVPMFVLGCVGLFSPSLMFRVVSLIS